MALNQSFSWWCFAGRGVEDVDLLRAAKNIGYKAVELLPDDKLSLAVDAGLVIASHPGHRLQYEGLNDSACHNEIEDTILKNMEVAKKFGIPNLIVFSGERRPGHTDEEGIENTAIGLKRVAKAAEDAGINLIIELLNSKVDHKGYQCDKTLWGVAVCNLVASPRVKLLYDIYHMQIMEGDVIRTIRDYHSYFAHYHTAGNPGRRDMDNTQELYYPPIAKAVVESGYTGYFGHEFIPKGEVVAALESAYKLCDVV
ncbi:MAG: TIM barrel protein [Fimbriimonas sp.]|nr:TIM barrel protein [Fimbriimonas sp.]